VQPKTERGKSFSRESPPSARGSALAGQPQAVLLLETSDTLDKIAARLGFADASNSSRTFKGIDGIAPGEFRRENSRIEFSRCAQPRTARRTPATG
jgi:hypothetical protein